MCVCVCVCVSNLIQTHCCSTSRLFDHRQAECKQSALNAEWGKRCCWPPLCIDSRWQMAARRFSHKRPLNTAGYSWHCYRNRRGASQINTSPRHARTQTHTYTHTHEDTSGTPGSENTLSLTVYTLADRTTANTRSCRPFLLLVQFSTPLVSMATAEACQSQTISSVGESWQLASNSVCVCMCVRVCVSYWWWELY